MTHWLPFTQLIGKKEGKLVGKEIGAGGELGYESALKENSRQFG